MHRTKLCVFVGLYVQLRILDNESSLKTGNRNKKGLNKNADVSILRVFVLKAFCHTKYVRNVIETNIHK